MQSDSSSKSGQTSHGGARDRAGRPRKQGKYEKGEYVPKPECCDKPHGLFCTEWDRLTRWCMKPMHHKGKHSYS